MCRSCWLIGVASLGEALAALIHTAALARWPQANKWGENRLNGFALTRGHLSTGLKPRCEWDHHFSELKSIPT
jgi:hypothetical protein